MSRLFDFAGGAGMGYSQPEPLLSKNSIALPPSLSRKNCLDGLGSLSLKWLDTTRGYQEETSVLTPDFIRWAPVQ